MSKPYGLAIGMTENGLAFQMRRPSQVEDAIWEAVESAINAGWMPTQFKREVASAWEDKLRQDAKSAVQELHS